MKKHSSSGRPKLLTWLVAGLSGLATCLPLQANAQQIASNAAGVTNLTASSGLRLGAYDPYGTFKNKDRIKIEHIYVPWRDVDLSSLDTAYQYARERGRDMLITVEPWSWSPDERFSPQEAFTEILAHRFDQTISDICTKAGQMEGSVTIRWGHEMDVDNKRYTWSRWSPKQYITAYKYFVDQCRKSGPDLKFMWSPRGEKSLASYYPGDRYVDVIGLSIFALQQQDKDKFGRDRTLQERVKNSYDRVVKYDKGVIIAEYGCDGSVQFEEACWKQIDTLKAAYPKLEAVVYYNEVESYPWPNPYGLPDWRVSETIDVVLR